MLEPLPTRFPDAFLTVQVIAVVYVVLTLAMTAALVVLWVPTEMALATFLAVGAVLLVPFWPLIRRHYPPSPGG